MGTIEDYQVEGSAATRLKMWQWAIDFARDHPLGGGFRAYEVSVIHMPPDAFNPEGYVQRGRATHSTWFEMLNELGYPGLIMFLALIALTLHSLYRVYRRTRDIQELRWAHDFARALAIGLIVLMAGSTFIGIGFKAWFWMFFALSFCLSECVRRSMAPLSRPAGALLSNPTPQPGFVGLASRRRAGI